MDHTARGIRADDVAAVVHRKRLRPGGTREVERRELFLPKEVSVIAATRDDARDVAPGIDSKRGGRCGARHVNALEHSIAQEETMTDAAAGVVSDDVSLRVDGATGGETGTGNVDRLEVALAQQKGMGDTTTDVASDDVPLRIDSRGRDERRPRRIDYHKGIGCITTEIIRPSVRDTERQ